jgi:glutamate synthase (NADPH/NADH) small chain
MSRKDSSAVRPGRLSAEEIASNFRDIHPPLGRAEALIEADRCYFCFDAPCTQACPTGIDIPAFIQKIRSDNIVGSAQTILRENIMGGICARVCPTETLCEQACVRNTHEDKPVSIGLLQRFATDPVFDQDLALFERGPDSGKRVAIVGGGPAGLSCAHRLSMYGHSSVIFNRDGKAGGLNEYGIAAYKTVDNFAQREVEYILSIGGIEIRNNESMGTDFTLTDLQADYDAVFLAFGLGAVRNLGLENEDAEGVLNAVDYIAELRQAVDKAVLPVGERIVVIGGGMTAIDIAVQSRRLGAERVDIVYRRGPEHMGASRYEQRYAQTSGVSIHHWAKPSRLVMGERIAAVEFERTALDENGILTGTGEHYSLEADIVFKAIGQAISDKTLAAVPVPLDLRQGKIVVDADRNTSIPGVWAGGDCVYGHDDLTVSAVQDGKLAATAIDKYLREENSNG